MTRPDDESTPANRPQDDPVELGWGQEPTDPANDAAVDANSDVEAVARREGDLENGHEDKREGGSEAGDGTATAVAAASGDADADSEDAAHEPRDERSMSTVPPALWVWLAAALLLVAGLGFLAGDRFGPGTGGAGGDGVNLAGASAGSDDSGPVAKDDGTYDASILGPREGAAIATMDDITEVHRRDEADPFALGAVDAPVVMTMFSDFECPFCARFATQTQPSLIADYVDEGLVRIEWNDSASGGAAEQSAQAGRAAAAQGKFWEFQAAAFDAATAKGNGHPEFTVDELVDIARTAGVEDLELFRTQVEDGTWEKPVQEATAYAQSIGVQGTPQFIIGGTPVSGALPEQQFRDYIELELMKAERAQNQE
ncbi:thioredoxin domain-containing protein [uncultured Corynebacterium sp.]|uniref:DsbA family protein n=1 Tax=uncultured Corynebacterium sp. TaxID=159447 RepID=UPI0025CD53A7|nr:thioredoxin domain-containing protein [uncultured Corynebacterium sp.]